MSFKVFRDPIHDLISLRRTAPQTLPEWGDSLVLALIDTPPLQRLRRISQLGVVAQVYPAASHSRFSHSLGVMHLARQIVSALVRDEPTRFTPREVAAIKVAALLHDIGHGPFSHLFEQVFHELPTHEAWGRLILERDPTIHHAVELACRPLGWSASELLEMVRELFNPATVTLGRQVISSQLDADRFDYLLRDAHFTGVTYGRFDLTWLVHSLRVTEVAGVKRICVDGGKGVTALESYLTARDHMYRQVYDHKTCRAFEALFGHLMRCALWYWREAGMAPPGTPPELVRFLAPLVTEERPLPELGSYLALDDGVIGYAIGHWARLTPDSPQLAELTWKSRLWSERRTVYRRLRWRMANGELSDELHDPGHVDQVSRFLESRGAVPLPVRDELGTRQVPLRLLAVVDRLERTPYAHLQYGTTDPILVSDGHHRVIAAERYSNRIDFLGHNRRRWARVFVDPRAEAALRELLAELPATEDHPRLAPPGDSQPCP